ncbi:tryptophan dimethylallyltransferase [Saccharopolyspora sp. HNM0983]|uniref:Tryptophan dimethylallyltransferase n=1 Tax=Saccharopolyspora montiporae TaxID=2781240 RepID=A0A929FYL9_9PSEU|nr:tryptophan dimethylallyltransferase family protein [Saccharopolyspora sp. HNM0983]MBE9375951.1 tryptophan dimethylallyltransferase [Saccharopolyspora sp. HNM0983]
MGVADATLAELTSDQLRNLCEIAGIDERDPIRLLGDILGPAGPRPLAEPPLWPSDVADDATPVEFSMQFESDGNRHLRVLAEKLADEPGPGANLRATRELLTSLDARYGLNLDRLRAVEDLFLADDPQGKFAWWYSFIFGPDSMPKFKIYINPAMHGAEHASALVERALGRLGLDGAWQTIRDHALTRDGFDHPGFFAVDLDRGPQARVKLYVTHDAAGPDDAVRAARAVPGIDADRVAEFCAMLSPETEVFRGRPLVSSYSFVDGDQETPSNYSLYLPIRDYVPHDAVARERTVRLLKDHGVDPDLLDRALTALTDRPLEDNTGLIAHLSLRMSPGKTGTTVYLSSEAYGGTPQRAA